MSDIETRAEGYVKHRKRVRFWIAAVVTLGCAAALATTYALTRPAETAGQATYCGMEEHQHSDACYEKRLVCGYGDDATAPHVHTDACYTTERVLTCGLEEGVDGHVHTDACYTDEPVLTCGIAEGAVEHVHTDACYETVLTCTLPEHTHTLACYSDPQADVEDASTWAESTSAAQLTGAWGSDAAAVARTQLGYAESTRNYQVADDGVTTKGYTRYGAWAGDAYGDWSASFVSFCLAYAGVPEQSVPQPTTMDEALRAYADAGLQREKLAYTPSEGDLALLDVDGDGACDHVGIVASVDDDSASMQVIVGDMDDAVRTAQYGTEDSQVVAYVEMPANPALAPEPADTDEAGEEDADSPEGPEESEAPAAAEAPASTDEPAGSAGTDGAASPKASASADAVAEPVASADADGIANSKASSGADVAAEPIAPADAAESANADGIAKPHVSAGADRPVTLAASSADSEASDGEQRSTANASAVQDVAAPQAASTSGTCGDNLTWKLEDGVLTISGTGTMADYYAWNVPWRDMKDSITSVVVEDGVTSIGNDAFYSCPALTSVSLPAGMTSIGDSAFYSCSSLTDIVLPAEVTSIGGSAFSHCSSLANVALSDGMTTLKSHAFYGCSSLKNMVLPDSITTIGSSAFEACSGLTSVTIPSNCSSVGQNAFNSCLALKEMRWDAQGPVVLDTQGTTGSFTLTVGCGVDEFPGSTFATLASAGCAGLTLEGPHYLTTSALVASFLSVPLTTLPEGEYFVDEQGVMYRIDTEANTATVAYCPPALTNLTIPANLPARDDGQTPAVVGVEAYAFNAASNLENLSFAEPEQVTSLADFAFINAHKLASINGAATSADVLATMPNVTKSGTQLFNNTLIAQEDTGLTSETLTSTKDNMTLTIAAGKSNRHDPQVADDTYLHYTGESAPITITISNPNSSTVDDGSVVRVYVAFDAAGEKLDYTLGEHTFESNGNTYAMTVSETSVPGCYCIEIERPRQGDTLSVSIGSTYPSPTTPGGSAMVWGGILTPQEKENLGDGLLPMDAYQKISWETKPDDFPVEKKLATNESSIKLEGDGEGGAFIDGPNKYLSYTIQMHRDASQQTLEGIGKDLMKSADFVDVLTLPDGVSIAPNVKKLIEEGKLLSRSWSDLVEFYYKDETTNADIDVLRLSLGSNSGLSKTSYRLELDEQGNLVLRWTCNNTDPSTEISEQNAKLDLYGNVLYVANPELNHDYTITNDISCTQHFTYSADQIKQDSCDFTVRAGTGSLTFKKDMHFPYGSSFGSSGTVTITASNPEALPYDRLASISDSMPFEMYMSAEDIAQAFSDDPNHQLTITISDATLCAPGTGSSVTGIDGSTTATVNRQNESTGTHYNGKSSTDVDAAATRETLAISWNADGTLSVKRGSKEVTTCSPTAESVQDAFNLLGFVVTRGTTYDLSWDLREDGQVVPLVGGQTITKTVPCKYKDTFMLLDKDTDNRYPSDSLGNRNYAYARDANNKILDSSYCNFWTDREFALTKSCASDGTTVKPDTKLEQGSVLDYALNVSHQGNGSYDALPLVDHMTGAQALLAPVELNAGADWAQGCKTVEVDGTEYYLLSTPGTYAHVWTAQGQMADTVTVSTSASGLDTLIKWYLTDYAMNRSDTVAYRAYVCPNDVVPGALSFSLNNETWLGDHESHRLYDSFGWHGTLINFDKKIVESVGDTGTGAIHSSVHEGEDVVYRLEVSGGTDSEGNPNELTLTGADMYDLLPVSIASWRWSTSNVSVSYADDCEVVNGDHWSVTDADKANQQNLVWADDFSITFTGTARIYVTLTFPSGNAWQEYASTYATAQLVNTYCVLGGRASVTHDLSIAGQVRLQKGVKRTGYGDPSNKIDNGLRDGRFYYTNNDAGPEAYVSYYVTLYNGGTTNLYLTDIQDVLPRGFTFNKIDNGGSPGTTDTESGSGTVYGDNGQTARLVRAKFSCSTSEGDDGRVHLAFHFTDGDTSAWAVSYDSELGMCYLKPGEAIAFSYVCDTNGYAGSDDVANNVVAMPYYDYDDGGLVVDEGSTTVAPNTDKYDPNDGGCSVWEEGQATGAGFVGGTSDTQWLVSDVSVERGAIKPGITKALTSKTGEDGEVTQNPVTVKSTDTLNWTITAENDGAFPVTNYTLTDSIPAPNMFTGTISYATYYGSAAGTSRESGYSVAFAYNSSSGRPSQSALLTISPGPDENTLLVAPGTSNAKKALTIGGDPVELECLWWSASSSTSGTVTVKVAVSVARDASGNAVLSLHFPDGRMAIPDGGEGVLTLSTKSTTNTLTNKQGVNTCFITPLDQTWDGTTNKGNMTSLKTPFADDALPTVRNSAPFTTSFGYVTSSQKSVEEAGDPENAATSTDAKNYIVLSDKHKEFRYTATVSNDGQQAMRKLVIIDNLPEPDDHSTFLADDPRFSEFKVSLAAEPDFEVVVTDASGNVSTLDAGSYRVEFSQATEFSSDDWGGAASDAWSSDAGGARSVRLVIEDADGTLIPAGAKVSLKFTCQIDGAAEPGALAWNSFGYHYGLLGSAAELEAAPLKVGVKVPAIPQIQKQLVDHAGKPEATSADATFSFMAYKGAALAGSYATEEELTAALEAAGIPHQKFSVTVPAGQSASEALRMDVAGWTWERGEKYTVVELPCGDDYELRRFANSAGSSITFTYDPATDRKIVCQNYVQRWQIDVTKTSAAGTPLAGAVFALYSPERGDALSGVPGEYADLNIAATLTRGTQTWYLAGVSTSGTDGTLTWDNLLRPSYYLLEVKAPDGYNLPTTPGQVLEREDERQGTLATTVVNRKGPSLPETGGPGTTLMTLGGAALLLIAGLLLHTRIRRGREGRAFD